MTDWVKYLREESNALHSLDIADEIQRLRDRLQESQKEANKYLSAWEQATSINKELETRRPVGGGLITTLGSNP